MSIFDSTHQQAGLTLEQRATELGWKVLQGDKFESALDFLLRKQYEAGAADATVAGIQELANYKNTVSLQKRVYQLQQQRIAVLEAQIKSLQANQMQNKPPANIPNAQTDTPAPATPGPQPDIPTLTNRLLRVRSVPNPNPKFPWPPC